MNFRGIITDKVYQKIRLSARHVRQKLISSRIFFKTRSIFEKYEISIDCYYSGHSQPYFLKVHERCKIVKW